MARGFPTTLARSIDGADVPMPNVLSARHLDRIAGGLLYAATSHFHRISAPSRPHGPDSPSRRASGPRPSRPTLPALPTRLADETRLEVVRKLASSGSGEGLSATALSDGANVTRQAIVKHLQVLDGAGLVTYEKRGREVLYSLDTARLKDARAFLDGISAGWDRALGRLRKLVED